MSQIRQLNLAANDIPKLAVGMLLGVAVFGIFAVGFDQGQLFSIFQGQEAYGSMWMHEFTHDTRHAAGFACH
ncbi:MAG: CbtB domain-containing protein [Nitrososphaera sp.]